MPAHPNPALLRGDLVRAVREHLGLTRGELAGMLGVSFDTIRSWEGNRRGTPPGVIPQLQQLQDELDEDAAHELEHYRALPEDGPAPVFTITAEHPRPAGWQRRIAARLAQHHPGLHVEDQTGREL